MFKPNLFSSCDDAYDLWAIAAIICYFSTQMCLRVLIGPTLDLDEAEALWHARNLRLGYGAQPPLYFWLQWIVFQVVGEGIFALAALKAAILSAGFISVFRTLRFLGFEPQAAVIGVLALGLMPEILWESQRALTHTVLAFAMTALALRVALNLLNLGRWRDYCVFGLILGLGILSKYNFSFVIVGITVALTMSRKWRNRGEGWRLIASSGISLVIALPLVAFAYMYPERALASVDKLAIQEGWRPLDAIRYLAAFGAAMLGVMALPILVIGPLAFWKKPKLSGLGLGFILRSTFAAVVAAVLIGLLSAATAVQGRWLVPVVWPFVSAPALALWGQFSLRERRNFLRGLSALWLIAALALPYAALQDPGHRNANFDPLLSHLSANTKLASDSTWVLGNLRFLMPDLELHNLDEDRPTNLLVLSSGGKAAGALEGAASSRRIAISHGIRLTTVLLVSGLN